MIKYRICLLANVCVTLEAETPEAAIAKAKLELNNHDGDDFVGFGDEGRVYLCGPDHVDYQEPTIEDVEEDSDEDE